MPSKSGRLVPPGLRQSCNEIPLAFKITFPEDSQSLCQIPMLGSLTWGARTFTTVGELLWSDCSPVCELPMWQVWDLILSSLCPSYHLFVAFSLFLDVGCLFLLGSSILLQMVVQQLVVILVLWQEEMSSYPSSAPLWTGSPQNLSLNVVKFLGALRIKASTYGP